MRVTLKVLLVLIVSATSFAVGLTYDEFEKNRTNLEFMAARPQVIEDCAVPTEYELQIYTETLDLLELVASNSPLYLEVGIEKFLAHGLWRRSGGKNLGIPVCPPDGFYKDVGRVLTEYELMGGRPVEYSLKLIERIPEPSAYLVDIVAKSAFSSTPQISGIFEDIDIRPYARTVLASYRDGAASYVGQAIREMGSENSLQTGAAQIAAVSGQDDVLEQIEALIWAELQSTPSDISIPYEARNRLYELAYALVFAGENARNYTSALKELMSRKVESLAPPYGKIALSPKRMCPVLEKIEGKSALLLFVYCSDETVPFDSY